ncbi:MAG TPA: sigma-70 family RNA polymerase sigma factor [Anaerolineales bacterium]|nr:sigma-70 family RNA polymerase sigma factor [Anaerolineales bacterium]
MSTPRSNPEWLQHLQAGGSLQEAAIADLRDLLLRAALYFFSRNTSDFQGLGREEITQRAEDCAQEALIAVLDRLPEFRGESQFSTWAYKFAINKALTTARRERWKGASLDELASSAEGDFQEWRIQDKAEGVTPEQSAMQGEIQAVLVEVIEHDLTEKQRHVLLMMVFQEVPLDEVVHRLGSNRNAVYKLLHDARRKLKSGLLARGFDTGETLTLFGVSG